MNTLNKELEGGT